MKIYLKPVFILFLGTVSLTAQSQSQTEKVTSQATHAINSVKQLFGKKKAKKDSTAATAKAEMPGKTINTSAASNSMVFDNTNSAIVYAGNVSPKTKVIDCDEMWPFNLGAAKIRKGLSFALIDSAGNFIAPFNQYTTIDEPTTSNTGIFKVQHYSSTGNTTEYYINSSGKILWDIGAHRYAYSGSYSRDGKFILVQSIPKNVRPDDILPTIIIDRNGKQYHSQLVFGYTNLQDSIFRIATTSPPYLFGFRNLNNQTIVKPSLERLDDFKDGVAVFTIRNEFGEVKTGVIDKKGKIVIPPTNAMMSRISSNILEVRGTSTSDFLYEFINPTTGQVIFKLAQDINMDRNAIFIWPNGYGRILTRTINKVLDPQGHTTDIDVFAKKFGIGTGKFAQQFQPRLAMNGGYADLLFFSVISKQTADQNLMALYNVNDGSMMLGPFTSDRNMLAPVFFDPVSHLSLVSFSTGKKDNLSHSIYISGYMNKKGELVLMKGNNQ